MLYSQAIPLNEENTWALRKTNKPFPLPPSITHSPLSAPSISIRRTGQALGLPDCPTCHVPHLIAFNLATQSATNYTAPNRWQTATSRAPFLPHHFHKFWLKSTRPTRRKISKLRHLWLICDTFRSKPCYKKIYRNKSEWKCWVWGIYDW